jgi:hypothetical protein
MDKFKVYIDAGHKIIEHLEYPSFRAKIKFNSPISDLEDIEMIDNCTDPLILASVMRDAAEFLINYNNCSND